MSSDWGYLIGAVLGIIFYFGCWYAFGYFSEQRKARKKGPPNPRPPAPPRKTSIDDISIVPKTDLGRIADALEKIAENTTFKWYGGLG